MADSIREAKRREAYRRAASRAGGADIKKGGKLLQQFFMKFGNDWIMGFASGLAFNLLVAIFPIFIALLSLFGLIVGGLDPGAKITLTNTLLNVFPAPLNQLDVLQPALTAIHRNVGFLSVVAVVTAIIGGSGLFVSMEGYFDVIYHTHPRNIIRQYIMAVSMLLFFLVLIPVMVFAATIPALVLSLLKTTPMNDIPGIGLLFSVAGIFTGLVISWIFFVIIYIVVPNQRISLRHGWGGALVAAVALQLYLNLFPLYVTHFLTSDKGTTGFVVILLFFFYYFAVILLLGAEVNAFFAENVRVTPDNVAAMVHDLTSHLPTSEQAIQQQASFSHKEEEPKEILPQGEAEQLIQQAQQAEHMQTPAQAAGAQNTRVAGAGDHMVKQERVGAARTPRTRMPLEVLTVAVVTVLIEFLRLRRGK